MRPLLPQAASQTDDDALFEEDPWVNAPVHADYGVNIKLGKGTFVNWGATFVDTCPIVIGDRVLIGPSCSFYSGTHPLDPALRDGMNGPELGKAISIGDDCWFGGNVIVLPGVNIGRGCSIGAGSVVTRVSLVYTHCYIPNDTTYRTSRHFMWLQATQRVFCARSRLLWIWNN